MESIQIDDFSFGLVIWQILLFIIIVFAVYFLVKLYTKFSRVLDLKTKQLNKNP
jgi:large-conductance mechanosensitive channel